MAVILVYDNPIYLKSDDFKYRIPRQKFRPSKIAAGLERYALHHILSNCISAENHSHPIHFSEHTILKIEHLSSYHSHPIKSLRTVPFDPGDHSVLSKLPHSSGYETIDVVRTISMSVYDTHPIT